MKIPCDTTSNKIINGDSLVELSKIGSNTVDLVITDPPFAINFKAKKANYNRDSSLVIEGYSEIKPKDYDDFSLSWIRQCFRILKESGSIYIFSGYNHLESILRAVRLAGFSIINHIIWKYNFGVYTKKKFVTSHYIIIYACKNPKKRNFYTDCRFQTTKTQYSDMEDVWHIKKEYWTGQIKPPTKLPTEIISKILSYSSKEGDLILDPFLGSGQVALVSHQMNRDYLGIEIVKKYYDFAKKRIKEESIV